MALFVYITPKCEEEAKTHGQWDSVLKYKERLLKEQRVTRIDNYPPPYLKKRFQRQQRMIALEKQIDEHVVVCFCRFLIRGNDEYINFKNNHKEFGLQFLEPLITDEKLKEWLDNQFEEEEVFEKISPTEEEKAYLYNPTAKDTSSQVEDGFFVLESEEWVKKLRSGSIQNQLNRICESIREVVDSQEKGVILREIENTIFKLVCIKYPQYNKVLLLDILEQGNESDSVERLEKVYSSIWNWSNIEEREILRCSTRGYPAFITVDEDVWIDIEKDNESNLALSPEESELLDSVHSFDPDKKTGFPLFINGRAGSGKSTILQYLFTDYIIQFLRDEDSSVERPIYLTYSKDLVSRSFEVVYRLINSGYQFAFQGAKKDSVALKEIIKPSFKEFQNFLLSYLDDGIKNKAFPSQNYVNYSRFKKLWDEKFGYEPKAKKEYGPDISWHIIRTFIKGTSTDGYLELDEYQELSLDERSVTNETFEKVYDKVWEGWYKIKCQEHDDKERELWDDQDLVQYLLDKELIQPEYPAVFCDESQDFTRIELEAILRMSLFSDRKLTSQDLDRVPFAFAGDPLQTLNPTGFRWESIKTIFVQKFVHSLDPAQRFGKTELNYRELKFNYRSSQNIVKLNNGIQALRSILFDYKNLVPQVTWQNEDKPPLPVWFKKSDLDVENKLKSQSELTIIVPCNEGAESDFVRSDEYLREIIRIDDKGIPQNVFSPSRAKGLEFNRVVLYNFGGHMPKNMAALIKDLKPVQSIDEKLSFEYFINQLYVAASRPKRRLFVIESEEGLNNLWSFVKEPSQKDLLETRMASNIDEWRSSIGSLFEGNPNSWDADREDTETIAKKYEENGIANSDEYFLRQAANLYDDCNRPRRAKMCKARALELEGEYSNAGRLYADIGYNDNAINAFWAGHNYKEIKKLGQVSDSLVVKFSNLVDTLKLNMVASFLDLFEVERFQNSDKEIESFFKDGNGETAIHHVLELLLKEEKAPSKEWISIARKLVELREHSFEMNGAIIAECFFRGGDDHKAIMEWEAAGETQSDTYKKAKLNGLIKSYEENDTSGFDFSEWERLGNHYMGHAQWVTAAEIFKTARKSDRIIELLNSCLNHLKDNSWKDLSKQLLKILIDSLEQDNKWKDVLDLVGRAKMPFKGSAKQKILQIVKHERQYWDDYLIKTISLSLSLLNAPNPTKANVARYLIEKSKRESPDDFDFAILGAAIERAGKFIDALDHYERMQKHNQLNDSYKEFAKKRWIKVKLKQANFEDENGKTNNASAFRETAYRRASKFGINVDSLSEFPKPTDFAELESNVAVVGVQPKSSAEKIEYPSEIRYEIDGFSILINRKNNALQITKRDTMEDMKVKLQPNLDVRSLDVEIEKKRNGFNIPDWNLRIQKVVNNDQVKLKLKFLNEGVGFDVYF